MKTLAIMVSLLILSACGASHEQSWVSMQTQGQSSGSVKASSHFVSVSFSAQAEQQQQTTGQLKQRIAAFENWAQEGNFKVVAQQHDLRPVYEYNKGEGRQLVGYKASQSFTLESLSAQDYQRVLQELPKFQPEQFRLTKVEATEGEQQQLKQRLIDEAYAEAKRTAQALLQSGELCHLQPHEIVVNSAQPVSPMMMRMESSNQGAMHKSHTEEEQSVQLNVSWRAQTCID